MHLTTATRSTSPATVIIHQPALALYGVVSGIDPDQGAAERAAQVTTQLVIHLSQWLGSTTSLGKIFAQTDQALRDYNTEAETNLRATMALAQINTSLGGITADVASWGSCRVYKVIARTRSTLALTVDHTTGQETDLRRRRASQTQRSRASLTKAVLPIAEQLTLGQPDRSPAMPVVKKTSLVGRDCLLILDPRATTSFTWADIKNIVLGASDLDDAAEQFVSDQHVKRAAVLMRLGM